MVQHKQVKVIISHEIVGIKNKMPSLIIRYKASKTEAQKSAELSIITSKNYTESSTMEQIHTSWPAKHRICTKKAQNINK